MARTINEIQQSILDQVNNQAALSELDSTSVTAIWRLFIYIVAASMWALENLFDVHRIDVANALAALKPHSLKWYVERSRLFQFGSGLASETDQYDISNLTQTEIEEQRVVKYAAAIEDEPTRKLLIKLASESNEKLTPLTQNQYDAFVAYINAVKDAGVFIQVINVAHDKLKLTLDVYYDPTILSPVGGRLDGSQSSPVQDAIFDFLKSLPFNGLFVKAHLVDALQKVEGVFVPVVRLIDATKNDSDSFVSIDVSYQPFSGYLDFISEDDLIINYIPQ